MDNNVEHIKQLLYSNDSANVELGWILAKQCPDFEPIIHQLYLLSKICLGIAQDDITVKEILQLKANFCVHPFSAPLVSCEETSLLYFRGCKQLQLMPYILEFKNLTSLNLSYCKLNSLPSEIGTLQTLEQLDLHWNRFKNVPPCVYHLEQLKYLNLESNNLSQLSKRLLSLQELETLNVSYNYHLQQIPEWLADFPHLRELVWYHHTNLVSEKSIPTRLREKYNLHIELN